LVYAFNLDMLLEVFRWHRAGWVYSSAKET
jgi:hypothetical protein